MPDFELSERGFKHFDPIVTAYGHRVRVYESSAASRPCLWLNVQLTQEMADAARTNIAPEEASAHMTLEQAAQLRDALDAAIENHYQVDDRRRGAGSVVAWFGVLLVVIAAVLRASVLQTPWMLLVAFVGLVIAAVATGWALREGLGGR